MAFAVVGGATRFGAFACVGRLVVFRLVSFSALSGREGRGCPFVPVLPCCFVHVSLVIGTFPAPSVVIGMAGERVALGTFQCSLLELTVVVFSIAARVVVNVVGCLVYCVDCEGLEGPYFFVGGPICPEELSTAHSGDIEVVSAEFSHKVAVAVMLQAVFGVVVLAQFAPGMLLEPSGREKAVPDGRPPSEVHPGVNLLSDLTEVLQNSFTAPVSRELSGWNRLSLVGSGGAEHPSCCFVVDV